MIDFFYLLISKTLLFLFLLFVTEFYQQEFSLQEGPEKNAKKFPDQILAVETIKLYFLI